MSTRLLLLLVVCLACGCMRPVPDVETHRVAAPVKVSTLHVSPAVSPSLQAFGAAMTEEMRAALSARNVRASTGAGEWAAPTDSTDVFAQRLDAELPAAEDAEADALLMIHEHARATERRARDATGWGYDAGAMEDVYVLDVRLVDVTTKASLWRARLFTRSSPMASAEERAQIASQQVVDAMVRDGWMTSVLAAQRP